MLNAIKSFFCPSSDFFGPKADEITCPVYMGSPDCPFVTNCAEGVKKASAIHELAQARATSKSWPEWQRWNGSIIFEKLPEAIKSKFDSKDELLDEDGYIKLSNMHILSKDALVGTSAGQIGDYPGSRRTNACPLHNENSFFKNKGMSKLAYSPALALRLKIGSRFDPRNYQGFFSSKAPEAVQLDKFQKFGDALKARKDLENLWSRLDSIEVIASQAIKKMAALSLGGAILIGAFASRKILVQSLSRFMV